MLDKEATAAAANTSSVGCDIEFINHACVIIASGPVRLLCDPWLSGTVFDNGWDHLVKTGTRIEDLEFSHIWFSHEHPDHFSPSELKRLPEERRRRTPVLFQKTPDAKVRDFCLRLGFSVIELDLWKLNRLADDFTIVVNSVGEFDSWIHIRAGGKSILNVNDCRLNTSADLEPIKAVAGSIDLLMTQFTYANWVGNPGDTNLPKAARAMVRRQLKEQIRLLAPAYVLPFAGFVRFCHSENAFWNDTAIRIDEAAGWLGSENTKIVVLYPGDRWSIGDERDNGPALERWRLAYDDSQKEPLLTAQPVPLEELQSHFSAMQEKLREKNDWNAICDLRAQGDLPAARVYLNDYKASFSFDIVEGLEPIDVPQQLCDVELSSDALATVLRQPWGRGTLAINGRFVANYQTFWRFDRMTQIAYANNVGRSYPQTLGRDELLSRRSFILELMDDYEKTTLAAQGAF